MVDEQTENKLAEDKLLKAKIKLQSRSPFFSYLCLFLKIRKAREGELPQYAGIGVDVRGILYYNPSWINKLTDEEMIGVLCHEIGHLALLHLLRRKNREKEKWNICADLAINSMLLKNGFSLAKGGILPDYNDNITLPAQIFGKEVKMTNCHKKTAEEMFEELPEIKKGRGGGDGGNGGWDIHNEGDSEDGDRDGEGDKDGNSRGLTPAELKELEEKWRDRIEEALMNSKTRGNVPVGMERIFEELRKSHINWRALLWRYVQELIPKDMTWAKKSKKSVACKTYLPSYTKEKIDVYISVDVSGSIGQEQLTAILSEIVGMARTFQNSINMRLLIHDVEVHNDYEIKNGNIAKIKKIKIQGGGGTSHKPVYDYIKEKIKKCKAVISFTDGFSDIDSIDFSDYPFEKVFVITKDGSDEQMKDKRCKVVMMKE